MAAEYEISVMDRTGSEQYLLTGSAEQDRITGDNGGYLSLEYTKEVNAPGLLTFHVDSAHALIDVIEKDWQVAVRRRDLSRDLDWYLDFGGLWRGQRRRTDVNGLQTWIGFCPGYLHFLTRSEIAYPADTTDRSTFTSDPAEVIAKTLVTHNATASGTVADGRDRNVDAWGANITVQTPGVLGNTLDYKCARRNLLRCLQEIALVGDGDFDLIKTADQTWQFRWYDGQRGSDLRDSLVFSLAYANMETPDLYENYADYPTVAIVGGQGTEAARAIEIRTAADHNSLYNSAERFVSATAYTTAAGLQTAGDVWLAEQRRNRVQLDFSVVQTEAYNYGIQYDNGDIFTAVYENITQVKQIIKTTISVQPSAQEIETIKLVTKNV